MSQPVNMFAPDGSPVNTDPEHVESLLAEGYTVAPDPALAPPAEQPVNGIGDVVNLFAPDGSPVNTDAQHVEGLLADGYTLATPEAMAQRQQAAEYGDTGSQIAAGLEGVAQGATLGGYGAVAGAVSDDYDRERRLRAQYNPGTELAGQVVGSVAPALLSGGTGTMGAAARLAPAALEASLGAKMATALGSRAASWMGSQVGKVAGRVVATGLESAADTALRTVLDDAANGDVDVTAERALDTFWKGLTTGSALELGMAGLGAGGRAAARGGRKLAGALGELPSSLADAAGEAAYKAAVGRTSIASQRLAARVGGGKEIGQTLLKRGLVKAGDTVEQIADRLPAAREQAGQELGKVLGEVGDATVSRGSVWDRIEQDVLAPLEQPGTQDVAAAVRAKLDASGVSAALDPEAGNISLEQLHQLRRTFDSRPELKWGASGPMAPDITTEAMRDVRRSIESTFEQASDEAAQLKGVPDYAKRLKQAKRDYSHLALAADVAEQGAFARAANNRLGLNDVLAGVAGAASLGPAGALAAVGSKLVRDRSEATAASLLYRLAGRPESAPMTALGRLTEGAAQTQQRVTSAADRAVHNVFNPDRAALRTAVTLASAGQVQRAVERAAALQDPNSRESQTFARAIDDVAKDDPALASALRDQVMQRSSFIVGKVPPALDPSDPLGRTPGRLDGQSARRSARYVEAAMNPQGALERLSSGVGYAEDLETLRALTPRLYQIYVQRAMQQVKRSKRAPTVRERMRLGYLLGQPMTRSAQSVGWYQSIAMPPEHAQQNPNLAPATPKAKVNTDLDPRDNVYASRTDEIMAGQ